MATGPLIAIVGQTASGKSDLALQLAERFNGEIICADSRTVYKGMDIGTAKPSKEDQAKVRHYLLDVAEPGEPFTVADFKDLAKKAMEAIYSGGKLPILVGGSGLYLNSILFEYEFPEARRDTQNPRHSTGEQAKEHKLRENTLLIGLSPETDDSRDKIEHRVDLMFEQGIVPEAAQLGKKYGWDIEPMKTYLPIKDYLEGSISLTETKQKMVTKDLQLAKKQRTWFRRNNSIHWLTDPSQVVDLVTTFLNKTP